MSELQENPIIYIPNFIENPNEIFKKLREELDWERQTETRLEYYCNDFPEIYTYGKGKGIRQYKPKPYHIEILNIRKKIENFTNCIFETCFLNRYLNQKDWLGKHSDDSKEMDPNRPIIIISLGVARIFKYQRKAIQSHEKYVKKINDSENSSEILLENGSICIMQKGMQQTHKHWIPKAGFVTDKMIGADWHFGERISLTYRGFLTKEMRTNNANFI